MILSANVKEVLFLLWEVIHVPNVVTEIKFYFDSYFSSKHFFSPILQTSNRDS